jgi:lysophospholipid acyltransferase (LPLAT)-like uncharacterized protein
MLPRWVAKLYRLLHGSCDFTILGREHEEELLAWDGPVLVTSWHFAFPAVIYRLADRDGMVMVSLSGDGEWVARILKHLGYRTARGSSGRGGSAALKHMIAEVKTGSKVGLVADGSRGPARIAQKGGLVLARHTRAPIYPVSMAAKPCWRFPSWDRTVLAKPFAKVVIAYGPAIRVETNATPDRLEFHRETLEAELNRLTERCEAYLNRS